MRKLVAFFVICWTAIAQLSVTTILKTVTTAGTPVRLASSSTPFVSGTIQALSSNTGKICVGGSTTLVSTNTGVCLTAGQAIPLNQVPGVSHDLNNWWMDSATNSEGASITYEK
ncbi:MAG TPA: hypothetical protein VHZ74_10685 [Bryobacteraceae bacterium]|jgi:hypothetical protein|nr:hypothetical protein [Bryobacteraceae bacterium]